MHLIILGSGEKRRKLEMLVQSLELQEWIHMPGFVQNPYDYMREADVFALSSKWEGFGNVVVEAMATGTPIVSTDCPSGPAEILEGGRWGKLVPVSDEQKMAEAIMETLVSPVAEGNHLVERAQDFAPEKVASQYLSLLNNSPHDSQVGP